MKIVLLFVLLATVPLQAQEETLLDGDLEHGGFGGPIVRIAYLHDAVGLMVGGGGAWLLNHTIAIGGAGYGLTTEIDTDTLASDGRPYLLDLGYGGLTLEYINRSDDLVHFTVRALVGAGGIGFRQHGLLDSDFWEDWDYDEDGPRSDAFFVVEPEVAVELNIARWMRLNGSVSYRLVSGVETGGLTDSDIGGPSAALFFKFGSF